MFTKTVAKSRVGGGGWRATKTWEWSVHVAVVLVYCPGSVVYKHRGLASSDGAPSAGQAVRRSAQAHRQHSPDHTAPVLHDGVLVGAVS